ncbi:metallophosphoesterase [Fournierella sp.]|uniref:metallophosphoesterase n=1 Tax=Allofournierella sp. TaxID=1940256 RepID=UPI0025B7CABD|nr:metallophosphoesterase [Fournierella sp.]
MKYKQTKRKRRWIWVLFWIVLAALLAGLYARFVEPNLLVVRRLSFQAQGIAADCRVVFFTDTHFGEDKSVDSAKQLADHINRLEPDLVIFGGDLLDNYARDREQLDLELLRQQLSNIEAPGGKYAVWGNHDWGGGAARIYQKFMESCGFRVLKNESLLLEEYQLQLLGYDDYLTGELGGQLPAFAEGVFPLLVAHEPYTAQLLSGIPERALMLSGHTHGGQVGIPWIARRILPPGSGGFVRGLYALDDAEHSAQIYVSSGIGTTRLPLRLLSPPEIVCIDLQPE